MSCGNKKPKHLRPVREGKSMQSRGGVRVRVRVKVRIRVKVRVMLSTGSVRGCGCSPVPAGTGDPAAGAPAERGMAGRG